MNFITKATILIICALPLHGAHTRQERQAIGEQIWFNEANKSTKALVHWHKHEDFPSLGIGHFIWQPKGTIIPYETVFPSLCHYLKQQGIALPSWLNQSLHKKCAPWSCREEFLQDTAKRRELVELLQTTIDLQTTFMIERLAKDLDTIYQTTNPRNTASIKSIVGLMLASVQGTYALVDYLNFKGSGLNQRERVKGRGWGLQQVLEHMPHKVTAHNVVHHFALSAEQQLRRRVTLAGSSARLDRFLSGWINRINTYKNKRLFSSITNQNPAC